MERCRTIPEVYGFEVILKQAIISPLPESLKIRYSRMNARSVHASMLDASGAADQRCKQTMVAVWIDPVALPYWVIRLPV